MAILVKNPQFCPNLASKQHNKPTNEMTVFTAKIENKMNINVGRSFQKLRGRFNRIDFSNRFGLNSVKTGVDHFIPFSTRSVLITVY